MRTRSDNDRFQIDRSIFDQAFDHPDEQAEREAIRPLPEGWTVTADDIHNAITEAQEAGAVRCPENLDILVFPSSLDESDNCLIVVWSTLHDTSGYVAAGFTGPRDCGNREIWEQDDPKPRTFAMIEDIVVLANRVIGQVRAVEKVIEAGRGNTR